MGEPTNSDIMHVIREMHGDIRVALERTRVHEDDNKAIWLKLNATAQDQAKLKGQATIFGTIASAIMVALIEGGKAFFPHSHG